MTSESQVTGDYVVHYADADRHGVTFVDELTLAPIPPLCDGGQEGDFMTFDWTQTTCPRCLAHAVGPTNVG